VAAEDAALARRGPGLAGPAPAVAESGTTGHGGPGDVPGYRDTPGRGGSPVLIKVACHAAWDRWLEQVVHPPWRGEALSRRGADDVVGAVRAPQRSGRVVGGAPEAMGARPTGRSPGAARPPAMPSLASRQDAPVHRVPVGQSRQQVENRLNKLGRQKWHVHIRERYPHGHGVLICLARYLRGGPIAPQRLVSCDGQQVVFWYTERTTGPGGQAKQWTMRFSIEQFIGRWWIHVPPAGAVRVRCWGLYAHNQGDERAVCRSHLGQGPVEAPKAGGWQRDGGQGAAEPVECCPVCCQRLVCVALVPRAGAPPPVQAVWEQVA
jgi:hypothetical protein